MSDLYACVSANKGGLGDTLVRDLQRRYQPELAPLFPDLGPDEEPTHSWLEYEDLGIEARPWRVRAFDPAEKHGQRVRKYRILGPDGRPLATSAQVAIWAVMVGALGHPYNGLGIGAAWLYLHAGLVDGFERNHSVAVFCSQIATRAVRARLPRFAPDPRNAGRVLADDNVTPLYFEACARREGWPAHEDAITGPWASRPRAA